MTRIELCPAADLTPGERRVVQVEGLPHDVGVFNVDGDYHALANVCPHHRGPLCEGTITGEMASEGVGDFRLEREGEVIRCPWHGWKFDISDGRSVFNPHLGTRTYEARVESTDGPDADDRPGGDSERGRESVRAEDGDCDGEGDEGGDSRAECEEYGTALMGEEPPVESYDVAVERDVVVLYV
jgi:nitrite reductase/ring-hydroxylating ferredoxin subunit